ncbi:MAG: fimbrillin family protein [Bacteroidales bacterium]|nr:fimbrillin family protein [Bacteroidales bacterium]
MKRYFQILASWAVAGVLWACSNEGQIDTPVAKDNTISFTAPFAQKNVSRALGDIDTDNFINSHFLVWGTATNETTSQTIFSETDVYYNGGVWTYDNPQKWDSGKKYKFAALAPSDNITKGNYSYYNNRFSLLNIPLSVKAEDGVDYLVSNQVNTTYAESSSGVQLNFKHIMSRLRIKVKYASDDDNLVNVTMSRLEINLPIGSARYEQTNEEGPSADDKWTWSQNGTNSYVLCDEEMAVTKDEYQELGNGFFVAPSPEDVSVTMNISYEVEIDFNGAKQTIPVTKENVEIPNFTSFKQGYISNLCLNIKPTGNDYAYIEISVNQQVIDHESNNGYINDKGQSFSIEKLWQADNQIYAEIDALDNEVTDGYYRLVSVIDSNGNELLNQENTFALNQVTATGNYEISSNVNALLDAGQEYTFVIEDKHGNSQSGVLYLDSEMGGASMQFTIKIDETYSSYRTFAIPFPISGTTYSTYKVDWGDGEINLIKKGTSFASDDNFRHQYKENGTYKVTLTSAIGDYSYKQMDVIGFNKYRYNVNSGSSYQDADITKLISLNTPLLNMGSTVADNLFAFCVSLQSIPKDLFKYNKNLTSLERGFQKTMFSSVPEGLFDPLENVETFKNLFRNCPNLSSIPEGLFSKNLKAYNFKFCFRGCTMLKLHPWIFISNESDKETRFENLTDALDFSWLFYACGTALDLEKMGTPPDLWNYIYISGFTWQKYGYSNSYNPFNSMNTEWLDQMGVPSLWIDEEIINSDPPENYIVYPYSVDTD